MMPLFWIAVNLMGLAILAFMYGNADKASAKRILAHRVFRYLQIAVMLYVIVDMGTYILEGASFPMGSSLHYVFSTLYYVSAPLVGFLYLLYCDCKVYEDETGLKRRVWYYAAPAVVSALLALLSPFTHMVYSIDGNNFYQSGDFRWIALMVAFGYVLASYPLLAVKTRKKRAIFPKGPGICFYLFPVPPLVLAFLQPHCGQPLLGTGFAISVFFLYIQHIQSSSEDSRKLSARFHNINTAQFAVVSFLIIAGMLWTFCRITGGVAKDYAVYHADSTAKVFSAYLNQETGSLYTEIDLSGAAQNTLSQYDDTKIRSLIIDQNGVIRMDSARLGGENIPLPGSAKTIGEEVTNPEFRDAVRRHLEGMGGRFEELGGGQTTAVELTGGPYPYAAIAPIGATRWSVVTLFDSSALFSLSKLLPPLVMIAVLLVLFAFSSSVITRQLIFTPLKLLVDSLLRMRENTSQGLYGLERQDEIGRLSNMIQELFTTGYRDSLTGIYNRRYMELTLRQVTVTLSRVESKLSIMMADVDFFKKYNDTYGHDQGDECLKAVAKTLDQTVMRSGDFVARYGGEEFVIVLPGTDEEGARFVADKILTAVLDLNIPHEKTSPGTVTLSIGITSGTYTYKQNWEEYLKQADKALYMAKRNGRNQWIFLPAPEGRKEK